MRFSREAFSMAVLHYSRQNHMKIGEVEEALAEAIPVNIETLRNWRKGYNGPGSDAYIEKAAQFLKISDWTTLFIETDGGNNMKQLDEKQKDAVKKIYDVCVEVLNHFLYLENVKAMLRLYHLRQMADPDFGVDDAIFELTNRMYLVIDQEYFYLQNQKIYDQLAEFATEVSDGVLESFREYEADPDQLEALFKTNSEKAGIAMQRLNGLVEI